MATTATTPSLPTINPLWPSPPPSDSSMSSSSSIGALSSTSSLVSTFEDIPSPPPPSTKTYAFFASPFARSQSPSPSPFRSPSLSPIPSSSPALMPYSQLQAHSHPQSPSTSDIDLNAISAAVPTTAGSLTADFFSTPIRTPSPPITGPKTLPSSIHPSRIFPSRYTSRASKDDEDEIVFIPSSRNTGHSGKPNPELLWLNLDQLARHGYEPGSAHGREPEEVQVPMPQKSPMMVGISDSPNSDIDAARLISNGNFGLLPSPAPLPALALPSLHHPSQHSYHNVLSSLSYLSTSSTSSTSSSTTHSHLSGLGINQGFQIPTVSTTNPHRLPTPPPLSPLSKQFLPSNSSSQLAGDIESKDVTEPTPRQTYREPKYAAVETDVQAVGQEQRDEMERTDVDLESGCIITSVPPCISPPDVETGASALGSVTPALDTGIAAAPDTPGSANFDLNLDTSVPVNASPTFKLLKPLGQGAFSSVWLAEDLSRVPVSIKARRDLRELRRMASLVNVHSGVGLSGGALSRTSSVKENDKRTLEGSDQLAREGSLRTRKLKERLKGTRPSVKNLGRKYLDERHGVMGMLNNKDGDDDSITKANQPMSVNSSRENSMRRKNSKMRRLVAVKTTPRRVLAANPLGDRRDQGVPVGKVDRNKANRERDEEERTRVGFVREVEILKHISHPNITALLEHLSTPSHHILVLPYLPGGDLLGLVNNDIAWSKLGENVLRRIWSELCKAVGWMHGVGLVHRDIKLENVLLTVSAFSSLTPASPRLTLETLPTPPSPLIKLTDFGLSRFIEVDENGEGELLWTRCGSEAYAAPELVMGTGSVRAQAAKNKRDREKKASRIERDRKGQQDVHDGRRHPHSHEREGFYDARETDAWACGVVLYALVVRKLPFGEGVNNASEHGHGEAQGKIGGDGAPGYGHGHGMGNLTERRHWLMKIARGEYEWPSSHPSGSSSDEVNARQDEENELIGEELIRSEGVKRIVGKLLVRDPRKRARIMDLWDDEWMWGKGGGLAVGMTEAEWRERERERKRGRDLGQKNTVAHVYVEPPTPRDELEPTSKPVKNAYREGDEDVAPIEVDERKFLDEGSNDDDEEEGDEEEEGEGWLLDQEGIGSVARQEVFDIRG